MPLFSRSLKSDSDEGVPGDDGAAETGARHTIGELLRETRQSFGGDINRIAATLRIRVAYLTAIEESQYAKLPGPVYAQGFVRAYAVHLGLDGDEAIRRFKQEVAGFEVTRDLSFPVPLAERSIPGGTMLLAALILAVCGYGLWYYVSTGDRAHPERVSAVPADIVAASQPPAPAVPTSTAGVPLPESSGAVAPTVSAAPPPAATTSPSGPPTPLSSASPAPAAVATATSAPVVAPPPATSAPPPPAVSPSPPVTASPVTATPATPSPLANTGAAPPPPAATPTPQVAAAPSTEPPPDSAATPATPPPRVFGVPANVPARIIVHAIKESWVQVSNGDNILTQRTLHPGDSVRVPDQPGLSLRTGNGAGIQFEIDGKLGKPLSGTVRTVALDADRLASGRPIVNQPSPNQAAHQADQDRAADQDQDQEQNQ